METGIRLSGEGISGMRAENRVGKKIIKLDEPKSAAHLFAGWEETVIWSCLQGVMGEIYADDPVSPSAAAAVLGDFCFLAGRPLKPLVLHWLADRRREFQILVPQNEAWEMLIEQLADASCGNLCGNSGENSGENSCEKAVKKVSRYAFQKEQDTFDEEHLRRIAERLEEGYSVRLIDAELFEQCKEQPWSRDFVSQYREFSFYEQYGLGVVILKDGEIVSGASSYSGYRGGIEIEIGTKEAYRRKGLASVCGARLILECRKRGLYPSWDAQNLWSVALAEKLGYRFSHKYTVYEVSRRPG